MAAALQATQLVYITSDESTKTSETVINVVSPSNKLKSLQDKRADQPCQHCAVAL